MTLSLKLSLKLVELKWEKVMILRILKNLKNLVNATSMESCFGLLTFYIGICYYQLKQYMATTSHVKLCILKSKVIFW